MKEKFNLMILACTAHAYHVTPMHRCAQRLFHFFKQTQRNIVEP